VLRHLPGIPVVSGFDELLTLVPAPAAPEPARALAQPV
jgi:hypothetical protein